MTSDISARPATHDPAFLRDFATRWLDAWNSHRTDEVLALLHPEVVWDERVFWPEILHGREAVRAYADAIWTAMPDVRFEEVQLFTAPADGRALVFFRQSGGAPARMASNRTFEATGCDIFLGFTGGLLSHYTAAFEIVDMLRQLGALPPREGKTGSAYLLSLTAAR